ncbi:MAG: phasin family protein [Colwellia sp.]|nr:phasin family protein [Colwellia sp.]
MFTQFYDISQASLKSFEKLFKLNVSTAQAIANQHSTLFANVVDDTIAFARAVSLDKDFPSVMADQKKFNSAICYDTLETWQQTTVTLAQLQKEAELIFITPCKYTSDENITKVDDQKTRENF